MSRFVALDVKLANLDLASICEIALLTVEGGRPTDLWHSLIDPQDYFDPFCVSQHGLDAASVAGQPTFEALAPGILERLTGQLVVTYTAFDRTALRRALRECTDKPLACQWLDASRVAKRAWHELSRSGYGLAPVTQRLGIPCRRHRAVDHATATAEVLVRSVETTGISVEEWPHRVEQPISPDGGFIARSGNPEGHLYGEVVVFTGALSVTRVQAAAITSAAGCAVEEGINKQTTILVVGDQDLRQLAGYTKSSKHRKAEQLVEKGQAIRIMFERDFYAAVAPPAVGERSPNQGPTADR